MRQKLRPRQPWEHAPEMIQEKEVHYYVPNITKEDYVALKKRSLIDKLYDGSAKNFVAALCRSGELTEKDIDELKEYFRMGDEDK